MFEFLVNRTRVRSVEKAYPAKRKRDWYQIWHFTRAELSDGHFDYVASDDHEDGEDVVGIRPLLPEPSTGAYE